MKRKNLYLEAENAYLKKITSRGSSAEGARTEEKVIIVSELRQKFPLTVLLKVAHLSRSTYYYQLSKKDKDEKNKNLMQRITEIFHEHKGRYGFRRITLELRNKGFQVNKKKVRRLMDKLGLKGKQPKTKYHSYKGDMNGTTSNQLLDKVVDEEKHKTYYERNFSTSSCNEKWTTDVSMFHIPAGKLYLSPILDMHNREIIAYNISESPNYAQIQDMLEKAFDQYANLEGLIFHSDQGWQYQMQPYRQSLAEKGSFNPCHERETVWTIRRWRISLGS